MVPYNILAVNPGSRYAGMAVFRGGELREWGIRSLRGSSFRERSSRLASIISRCTDRHGVNVLAIKKLHPSRSSKMLQGLVSKMKTEAGRRRLKVREYSIGEVKNFLLPNGRGSKIRLAEEVTARYPFLFREMQRGGKGKNPYPLRMFEAVAVGIACFGEHDHMGRKVGSGVKRV